MMTALLKLESPWNNPPSAADEMQTNLAPTFSRALSSRASGGVRPKPGTGSMARTTMTAARGSCTSSTTGGTPAATARSTRTGRAPVSPPPS